MRQDFVTPSQTVGPFFACGLPYDTGPDVAAPDARGALRLHGRVLDGEGEPVPDALIEVWQVDPEGGRPSGSGIYAGPRGLRGFGRCATDEEGGYWFRVVKPAAVPAADGTTQAPHLAMAVFARGLLRHLFTRVYFPDEEAANAADALLAALDPDRRATMVATPDGDAGLVFDIHLQDRHGTKETVFLDLFG